MTFVGRALTSPTTVHTKGNVWVVRVWGIFLVIVPTSATNVKVTMQLTPAPSAVAGSGSIVMWTISNLFLQKWGPILLLMTFLLLSQSDDHRDESDPPPSQSVLADLSAIVNEVCEAMIEVLESSYDDAASLGRPIRPLSRESSMVELSNVRKRGAPRPSSKERDRKASRIPTRHIPASVSSAVFLARSNSSLSS